MVLLQSVSPGKGATRTGRPSAFLSPSELHQTQGSQRPWLTGQSGNRPAELRANRELFVCLLHIVGLDTQLNRPFFIESAHWADSI